MAVFEDGVNLAQSCPQHQPYQGHQPAVCAFPIGSPGFGLALERGRTGQRSQPPQGADQLMPFCSALGLPPGVVAGAGQGATCLCRQSAGQGAAAEPGCGQPPGGRETNQAARAQSVCAPF